MNAGATAAVVGLLALAMMRGRKKSERPLCPAPGSRVTLIGDSLAVGLEPHLARHASICGVPFDANPFVGAHVTEWIGHRLAAALASGPNLALISLGGNDFQRTDAEHVHGAIVELVSRLHDAGVRPLWIAPPSMPFEDTAHIRAAWWGAMGGRDVIDLSERKIPRAPDQIHPTQDAYRELAADVWRWMSARSFANG